MIDIYKEDQFVVLGQIVTAHGVKGGLKIKSFTEQPQSLFSFAPFWVGDQKNQSWVRFHSLGKDFFIAFLGGVNDRTTALALRGQLIHIMRSQLPDDSDHVYYVDLQGRQVVDVHGHPVGCVKWVHDFGAGPVLEMKDTGHMMSLRDIHNADDQVLRLRYAVE
jgi:16S rRNA processing protein RimM